MNNGILTQNLVGYAQTPDISIPLYSYDNGLPSSSLSLFNTNSFNNNTVITNTGNLYPINTPYNYPQNNFIKNLNTDNLILIIDTTLTGNNIRDVAAVGYSVIGGALDFVIDWGDGLRERILWTDNGNSRNTFHKYNKSGRYIISISGALRVLGSNNTPFNHGIIACLSFGTNIFTWLRFFFSQCPNLKYVPRTIPASLTFLDAAFVNCRSLDSDLSAWNVVQCGTFARLFEGCSSFNNDGKDGIKDWNTSNVTAMNSMFLNAINFNQPLDNWNVRKVTTFNNMFNGATRFNSSLSGWALGADTTNVNAENMFIGASVFNQNIGNWDVSKVTSTAGMFQSASQFNNGGNSSISGWNTSNVNNMNNMFWFATSFNQPIGSWNVGNVTSMINMFNQARNFNQNLDTWNVRKVTNFSSMFNVATGFNSSLSGWALGADVSGVNCSSMFLDAASFNQDIGNWDVSKVTNMSFMLASNTSYVFNNGGSSSINNWNTSNVTNMSYMFGNNRVFNQPIGNWNVSKVQTMNNMLQNTNVFNQDISNWNLAGLNVNTGLDGFMFGKTGTLAYSTANYDALLIGWNNNKLATANGIANWRTDLRPNFGGAKYTSGGAAATARAALVSYGWTITDGGVA